MYAKLPGNALCGVLAAASLFIATALAAPPGTRPFDKTTWQTLKKELPRPSVVVFTTTDCVYCPEVIESLAVDLKKGKSKALLAVVVMDGLTQPESWLKEPHYRKADRLYVFEGQDTALRFGIDPRWRGMTPYLAMFKSTGEPKFLVGRPSSLQIAELFGR